MKSLEKIKYNNKKLLVLDEANIVLLQRSEEREVFGVGSIPVAILPSCQYKKLLHYNCINMNVGV